MRRVTSLLAILLWLLFLLGVGGRLALTVATGVHPADLSGWPLLPFAAYATVGLLIAIRKPGNALGWIFLAIGVITGVFSFTDEYLTWALHSGAPPTATAVWLSAWVQAWGWYPILILSTAFTLLLFPSGLPSRRWRPLLWLLVTLLGAVVLMAMLQPYLEAGPVRIANPIGISAWHVSNIESTPLFSAFGGVLALSLVASVASLVLRFRRARGAERLQLKWFVLAAAVLGVVVLLTLSVPAFNRSDANDIVLSLALCGIPVACGVAIIRYRLYEIDRIVSRTVSYGIVTALLAAVYVGCVALMTDVLPLRGDVGTAASVLVAVALFTPLRRRVQSAVDRRFNRSRYDAERVIAELSQRLRDEVDLEILRADLLQVVDRTVAPRQATLWLRGPP